uniref:Uncharacterized protein n=1 Tax=Romanomermis culicivorax TaxID=13658 RepID=A0A915L3P0_ROMCU
MTKLWSSNQQKKSVNNHQLGIDKLMFALNRIEMEADEELDQTVKQKLKKHASAIKLQRAQVLTKASKKKKQSKQKFIFFKRKPNYGIQFNRKCDPDPPTDYEQYNVALEQAFPNQRDALFNRQKATFMEQEILRDEANVVFSPSARYNVGLQELVLALQPSGSHTYKQIHEINEKLNKLCIQMQQNVQPKQHANRKSVTCHTCGKVGHFAHCNAKFVGKMFTQKNDCRSKCFHCKKRGTRANFVGRSLFSILFDEESESLDYDDSPTPTCNLDTGRPASQSSDSGQPRTPRSSCSDEEMKIIQVGKKENCAPRLETSQVDSNWHNDKSNVAPLLEKFGIPRINRQPRVPLLAPSSLEPNMAAFQEETLPKPIWGWLEEGQVVSWDSNNVFSTLGDLGGCKANTHHCIKADGFIVWEETPLAKICPFQLKNLYKIKLEEAKTENINEKQAKTENINEKQDFKKWLVDNINLTNTDLNGEEKNMIVEILAQYPNLQVQEGEVQF